MITIESIVYIFIAESLALQTLIHFLSYIYLSLET
jgi:hypothetical protein